MVTALDKLEQEGRLDSTHQDEKYAAYAKKITKEEGCIDWDSEALAIHNKIRAFNPWPVCYTHLNGKKIRVWQACIDDSIACTEHQNKAPGTICYADRSGIGVNTSKGLLRLQQLQLPNANVLCASDILNANSQLFAVGTRFN